MMEFEKVKTALLDKYESKLMGKTPYLILRQDVPIIAYTIEQAMNVADTPALALDLIFLTDEEFEKDYEYNHAWQESEEGKIKLIKLKNKKSLF